MSIAEKLVTVAENQPKVYDAGHKAAIDRYCPDFIETDAVVTCKPVGNYPLKVVSDITPIQAGSGDTSPTNIRPLSAHTSVKVTRCGENLWDMTRFLLADGWAVDEDGAYYGSIAPLKEIYNLDRGGFLKGCFKQNTSYLISVESKCPTNANGTLMVYAKYTDGSTACVAFPKNNTEYMVFTATTPNNKTIDCLYISSNYSTVTYIKSITLCEYGVATDEPYRGDTFTAQLGQAVYAGNFNWSTGLLTLTHKQMTITGDEANWIIQTDSIINYNYCNDSKQGRALYGWCSHAPSQANGNINGEIGISKGYAGGYLLFSAYRGYWNLPENTGEAMLAYVKAQAEAGTPIQIVYELKTPITVQLTPQEILGLEGTNTIYSDTGNTTVKGKRNPSDKFTPMVQTIPFSDLLFGCGSAQTYNSKYGAYVSERNNRIICPYFIPVDAGGTYRLDWEGDTSVKIGVEGYNSKVTYLVSDNQVFSTSDLKDFGWGTSGGEPYIVDIPKTINGKPAESIRVMFDSISGVTGDITITKIK